VLNQQPLVIIRELLPVGGQQRYERVPLTARRRPRFPQISARRRFDPMLHAIDVMGCQL
jgi:hypothetical protein